MTASARIRIYLVLIASVLGYLGYRLAPWPLPHATPGQPTVLLFVLDTVRSQSVSVCGYERPTTPYLDSLRERGAQVYCHAYAPSSWTLPSHATFFTGVAPCLLYTSDAADE